MFNSFNVNNNGTVSFAVNADTINKFEQTNAIANVPNIGKVHEVALTTPTMELGQQLGVLAANAGKALGDSTIADKNPEKIQLKAVTNETQKTGAVKE